MVGIKIRNYNPETDCKQVSRLYENSKTYGGQYDEARDSEERLRNLSRNKPNCILVAEIGENIVGTVTIFEDGRSAWLVRSAAQKEFQTAISKRLYSEVKGTLKIM